MNTLQTYLRTTITTKKTKYTSRSKTPQKWATFTYYRKEVRQITKLFKNTQLRVAFRTKNKIGKYNNRNVYQMKCLDCPFEMCCTNWEDVHRKI
jgi:hypothetical protein